MIKTWKHRTKSIAMLSLALILSVLVLTRPVAADNDSYRYWGQGYDNGYHNGRSYSGWCPATAYTKILIQSGAYDNDFTPQVFSLTMRERTGGSVAANGYCYFHASQVAKISNDKLDYVGQVNPGNNYVENIMDYVRDGYAIIVQVPGHYFAIDREMTLACDRPYVMDSYQWHTRAERLKYSVVPIEEEMYIARGYRPFNLILFKVNGDDDPFDGDYGDWEHILPSDIFSFILPTSE